MNEMQQRFLDSYLVTANATEAAREAGYSPRTAHAQGSRLLRHPEVSSELEKRQQARAERVGLTADVVLEGLIFEARHAREGSARVRSLELLGKHLGLWAEKRSTTEQHLVVNVEPARMRQVAQRLAAKLGAPGPAPAPAAAD